MTEMVTLRLIFYGLMAFVPNDSSPTSLHALLVDARGHHYSSDGCKLPRHTPALYVSAEDCTVEGETKGPCRTSPQIPRPLDEISGSWLLDGDNLSLEIVPPDGQRQRTLVAPRKDRNGTAIPITATESEDLSWLPSMPAPIDQNCLGAADDCPIAARFKIDDGRVSSCLLFENDINVVPAFDLRPLDGSNPARLATDASSAQAMTTAVLVTLQVPRNSEIRIVSTPLADSCRGRKKPTRSILLKAGDRPTIDVWITNMPQHDHTMAPVDKLCEDHSIDRHYEMYYNLVSRRIPFSERAVPHSAATRQSGDSDEIQPRGERRCKLLEFSADDRVPGEWQACGGVWVPAPSGGS